MREITATARPVMIHRRHAPRRIVQRLPAEHQLPDPLPRRLRDIDLVRHPTHHVVVVIRNTVRIRHLRRIHRTPAGRASARNTAPRTPDTPAAEPPSTPGPPACCRTDRAPPSTGSSHPPPAPARSAKNTTPATPPATTHTPPRQRLAHHLRLHPRDEIQQRRVPHRRLGRRHLRLRPADHPVHIRHDLPVLRPQQTRDPRILRHRIRIHPPHSPPAAENHSSPRTSAAPESRN